MTSMRTPYGSSTRPRPRPPSLRPWLALLIAALALPAAAQDPLTTGQLLIQGSRLTLYADAETNDADQAINVGERARVRTCFGGVEDPCGSVFPGDPRVAGLAVRAELVGPEAPGGIALETVPGGTFVLPGFQQEGDYRLENVRLVETASGRVLGAAEPPLALLRVREIVLTSATVTTLSLADLAERGISLSEENFQAFNFAVGFAFGSEIVEIELPLLYAGQEVVAPLKKPAVRLDGLPSGVREEIERWQPPDIVPFVLKHTSEEPPELEEEEDQSLRLPLFGAIVLPGSVSYLNQFFEAQLIVANGAPAGTAVQLTDVAGVLRLPDGNVLRVVASEPSVAPGQAVPVVQANGGRVLDPGEQAAAAWTVEGLRAGTHVLRMDVTGQIERPGRDPFPVLTRTQAAVEVVDARFNLTFSHPDVVREGEAYSLYVTVTNLSRVTQNLITVDLAEQDLSGAHPEDPGDTLARSIETLEPGQAETLEYRLVAELDGKVAATTFQSDSAAGTGTIRLRTGVGELGIPLSPATLVLPRFSDQLDAPHLPSGDFLRAHVRFLGLAYSLAVAPSAHVPPELPKVIRSDVERRAVDVGQAGMRAWLGEPLLETLEVFALDQLGNRAPLEEIDELRRLLSKGEAMAVELAVLLRQEQGARGLGAVGLLDHLAATASYADPWLAAVVVPDGTAPAPGLEIHRPTGTGPAVLAGVAGGGGTLRGLPFGEVYGVRRSAGGGDTVPLAVVGHLEPAQRFEVVLRNTGSAPARGRLVLVLPDDLDPRTFRRVDLGVVEVPGGGALAVEAGMGVADPSAGGFVPYHLGSGIPAGGTATAVTVARPPFALVGARQDFRLLESGPDELGNWFRPNRYGNGVVYLFNRPPEPVAAETAEHYRIRSTFAGLDLAGDPASGVSDKVGTGAWVQDDPRVVAVRYSSPLSALIDPSDGGTLSDHQHLLDTGALVDGWGEALSPGLPPPVVDTDPLHVGGLVDGRVLRGTGEPAADATVRFIRVWELETPFGTFPVHHLVGEETTGADGRFFFDYAETPHWDGQVRDSFVLQAEVPEGDDPDLEPADEEQVTAVLRHQNRVTHVNIALLGRGVITGELVWADDGTPVAGGRVTGASTLFDDLRTTEVESDGSFRLGGVAVGPITLTGEDADNRHRVYATVGVEEPGAHVHVRLEMPRTAPPGNGTVRGRVERFSDAGPVADARVAVYSEGRFIASRRTDTLGRFLFEEVPAGQVSLQAADFTLSRGVAFTDLTLAAGETAEVLLRLADGAHRTVVGQVVYHDPVTNTDLPVEGAAVFIPGPGVFTYTGADGTYRLEGVPVQAAGEGAYSLRAIDFERQLEGGVTLPPITDASPDEVLAQRVVLERMTGSIDGVVLDPLGRPMGGVSVYLYPLYQTTSGADGSFSFADVDVDSHLILAAVGDGLQTGRVGYFNAVETRVVYGGHRPFVTLRLRGSGVVTVHTTTASATGVLTPIYYKPTWFHQGSWSIKLKGAFEETSTDPNGNLELVLPVGEYELVAYNPFHGIREIHGEVRFAGETIHHEIVFEDAATVTGRVVDVDGHTPVPGVEVTLHTRHLLPQTHVTDAQGDFRFELVPKGSVTVTAAGVVGTVERVGSTYGTITLGGQTLDLVVRMKAQGTVRGQVLEQLNGELQPLPFAQFYVRENAYPFRRLPSEGTFYLTDGAGRYQVSHVYAGDVTVIARDSNQVTRTGQARGTLAADWEVVDLPDVVMSTSVGRLEAVVRDPETGGPVADAQIRLSNGEASVSRADGTVAFDALPLGGYSIYAFHAPTGRSGRVGGLVLSSPGQVLTTTVLLDQRGEVRGTLYDDDSLAVPVVAGTVRLAGQTAGGAVSALATTSSAPGEEGRFVFLGIPEGSFDLAGAAPGSARRAAAEVTLTPTAPVADVVMVLEPVGDVYVRLFEKLTAGSFPVDLASGVFSLRMRQSQIYDFTRNAPEAGSDVFLFPDLLLGRLAALEAREASGEQRDARVVFQDFLRPPPVAGAGSQSDPYRLVLRPKGVVTVAVADAGGNAVAGAEVTLNASGARFPSVTGGDGTVTFAAVPAGSLTASATSPTTGTGGTARGTLTFDDEVVALDVTLAPAVAAHGVVYQPVPDDRPVSDPSVLVPAPEIIVEIRDSANDTQLVLTDADGAYRFDVLPTGGYVLTARDNDGDQVASVAGSLVDGSDNEIPALVLDASPPRIVSIVPPPGLEGVSRTAAVEITFSEPLHPAVLPSGQSTSPYFSLRAADGSLAAGSWTSELDAAGLQRVRFTPSAPYANFTVHSLTIEGGANGVRDRVGRPLSTTGDVGSNFKTSDGIGPQVIATEPSLALPVDPERAVRFDFNEAVEGPDELFDGDQVDDAVELYGLTDGGGEVRLPVTIFLTRSGYSAAMQIVPGVSLPGDTLRRRVVVRGLADVYGNPMPDYEATFRLHDASAPVVDAVPFPDGAPDGDLTQGVDYLLVPQLSAVDDVTPADPGGDVARVDYFFADPTDPVQPVAPSFSAPAHPFAYPFVGAYSGDGVEPRPFPVWVQAVDTSGNRSNVVLVEMRVLPNAGPAVAAATLEALAPVAGTFYAGSDLRATVSGFDDADGSQLTLAVELRADGVEEALTDAPDRALERPASGSWADLAAESYDFRIPLDLPEGTPLYVLATVFDSQGATGTVESDRRPVADDATPAVVTGLATKLADGRPEDLFFIGEQFVVELRADDAETAVDAVTVELDRTDVFPEPLVVNAVAGDDGLYRTEPVTVPVAGVSDQVPLTATATVTDLGGNTTIETLAFTVAPEPDPTAPVAAWTSPRHGDPWPALHDSPVSPDGTALLLTAEASDLVEDPSGALLPGTLVSVRFRGPVRDATSGALELSPDWVDGELIPGTEAPGRGTYRALWRVPDGVPAGGELTFEVEVIDSGATATVEAITLSAAAARRVYEGVVTAVAPTDAMLAAGADPAGAVFLLDGTTLSIRPQDDGTVRSLPALHLYTGGATDTGSLVARPSVLTAPEITTYASAVLYHPLELALSDALTVGLGSRVDMTAKGLLGGTPTLEMVLPGETKSGQWAGGSHGGRGGPGSPNSGWDRSDLTAPGDVYDSLRDPYLPGAGGTSDTEAQAGGAGGGVVRILAGGATVRLDGDLLADGGEGSGGGGAGGAVRLAAGRLDGAGRISATGGRGSAAFLTGGGGGGRVAVSYRELGPDFDPALRIDVAGGINDWQQPAAAQRRGGAGTVFLARLDPATGAPLDAGRAASVNPEGLPAAITPLPALGDGLLAGVDAAEATLVLDVARVRGDLTGDSAVLTAEDGTGLGVFPITAQERVDDGTGVRVRLGVEAAPEDLDAVALELAAGRAVAFHGRSRLATVAAGGVVRLLADDDLLLGPAGAETLNDRAHLELGGSARALLRGETPSVAVTATPAAGSDLLLGASVEVSWQADDPLGLARTETAWSLDAAPQTTVYADAPGSAAGGPDTFTVPLDAEPGPVTYGLTATDVAGRTAVAETTWNVLPNEAPTVTLALGAGAVDPAPAGYALPVTVTVADREGLAHVTLLATGPVTAETASQGVEVSGTAAELAFEVQVLATADGSAPVVLQAVADDLSGAATTSDPLSVTVEPNALPAATLALADGAADRVKPGESTSVTVTASDPDGLDTIELQVAGAATAPGETRTVSGTDAVETFTVTAAADAPLDSLLTVTAVITDTLGAATTTASLDVPVVSDTDAPVVTISLDPETASYTAGDVVTVTAGAVDDVAVDSLTLTVDGETLASAGGDLTYVWTLPPVSATTVLAVDAEAVDPSGNTGSAHRDVTVEPLADDVAPEIAFTCPTGGAVLPTGYEVTLTARASDDLGVAWVDFSVVVDGVAEPFERVTPAAGQAGSFDATTTYLLPALPADTTLRAEVVDSGNNVTSADAVLTTVDTVDLAADGAGSNDWAALAGQTAVLRSGTVTVDQPVSLAGLVLLPGTTLRQAGGLGAGTPLSLDVTGPLYVGCGATVDASFRGYGANSTYPGHGTPGHLSGGSHLGEGGVNNDPPGETYGSVYFPQEAGAGGRYEGIGGGVVRISAGRVQVDGSIRADGSGSTQGHDQGAAGGSVWVTAGTLAGGGGIATDGARACCSSYGQGGGGAIAVEYAAADPGSALLDQLSATTGSFGRNGGAGSVYLRGPDATDGDLRLANAGRNGVTRLPALGGGTAQAGSGGALLVTERTSTPAYFAGHWVEIRDGATGALKGSARVDAIDGGTLTLTPDPGVLAGDLWQGVYRFDSVEIADGVILRSDDPVRVGADLEIGSGTVRSDRFEVAGTLRVAAGATLTHHATTDPADPRSLVLDVGELVVEEGGVIEASFLGYRPNQTQPGHVTPGHLSGGSHVGEGGVNGTPAAQTYGSVYRPREPGGGGRYEGPGGGVVRIDADRVQVDGVIRANGSGSNQGADQGGAGGSVWVTTGAIAGGGLIEARGARACCSSYGQGGGGAVSVVYASVEAGTTLLDDLHATTGIFGRNGGAGSVYYHGPGSVYGELLLDNDGRSGVTRLPALGGGTAQAGSGGPVLVTDRATAIPVYFAGHWVEIYDGATGALETSVRVASVDGATLTLEGAPSVDPGDGWQGVYRFDRVHVTAGVTLLSDDPVRVEEETVIASGTVRTDRVEVAGTLRVAAGATLTHHATTDPADPQELLLEVGELVVEAGGAIDASFLGYRANQTYPGHGTPGHLSGGSHVGQGGVNSTPAAQTYGSVYRPREPGGGGRYEGAGGGVVRIVAGRVQVDGAIRANGTGSNQGADQGGAGGSVWLTTGALAGGGLIEARGARACCSSYGQGGGGAVAVEYATLEPGSTLLADLHATTGSFGRNGGAGSVYVHGPASTHGSLLLANDSRSGVTRLPALGSGTLLAGSGGGVLVTDRAADVPAYFAGHWVEVYDGATGALKGTARVSGVSGTTLAVEPAVGAAGGDLWQGVYRFDAVEMTAGVTLLSDDPVRVVTETLIASGTVRTDRVEVAGTLRVAAGATLTHHATTDPADPQELLLEVGELVVEAGGAVDASFLGYRPNQTFPGHGTPGHLSGGSHVGQGGVNSTPAAETYGSVYRPREPGGGGRYEGPGGGVVRIVAGRVQVDGAIRANGTGSNQGADQGGAGGSVWLTTGALAGGGLIEARGARACCSSYGQGGGGAVAVEYATLETGSTLLADLHAATGSFGRNGGAGSVYLHGPGSTYGSLLLDNDGRSGVTRLPALGSGAALSGSGGVTLVTDRAAIPAYFAGHWVEVHDAATGALKGTARVEEVAGDTLLLSAPVDAAEGDPWQGIYRFDDLAITGGVTLQSDDPVRVTGGVEVTAGTVTTDRIEAAGTLRVAAGAVLTHPAAPSATDLRWLTLDVGELLVEAGGAVDVSGRGFAANVTWPDHLTPGHLSGGSHMGRGGVNTAPAGQTFGSVYFPLEPGAGGRYEGRGGGAVAVVADRVQVDGVIRADGHGSNQGADQGGAGGSVWIDAATVAGTGSVEADGARACCSSYGQGGGGAVAVWYDEEEAGSTLLDSLFATTGSFGRAGGAGTVYLHGPGSDHGDLILDNGGPAGVTELPSLGSGVAQTGTAGDLLVTDRVSIPAYFVGHWVRVEHADRTPKGTWRVGAVDGGRLTLLPNGTETIELAAGDEWAGIYRFDTVIVTGGAELQSGDEVVELGGAPVASTVPPATSSTVAGQELVPAAATTADDAFDDRDRP